MILSKLQGILIETIYTDEVVTLRQFVSFLDSNKTFTIIDWTEVIYPDSNPSYLSDNPRTQTEYYQDGKITATQLQHRRFQFWADKLAVTTQTLNSAFMTAMADICCLLPGAKELISALTGKVNMGIITNGFTELQRVRLEKTGLKDVFAPLVISEQVGIAKPDIGIFEYALTHMGDIQREQVLMVGDNPHSDILGGMNAGFDTCWLNSENSVLPDGIKPSYQVTSLTQLQSLLFAA
ncbi:MAG: pyrimidine 5'-nucleotidase [Moritella sp.]|nr:pyrimidine 5'-nucleotidase [Moritella sp.]